jgi:DNA-binding transcriptional regulator PaaX
VIIFDISEGKRGLRDRLRYFLVTMGFLRLQASVWVFPYDCSEFISLLKADLKIGRDVLYMVVDSIECDDNLKRSFGLK